MPDNIDCYIINSMNYKRLFIQGSYVFLTVVTHNRKPILINNIELLRKAFKNTKKNYNFEIFAIVILPEHFHVILNPQNIHDYPKIMSSIKHYFSRNFNDVGQVCPTYQKANLNKSQNIYPCPTYDRNKLIWQRRYWEHTIRDEEDLYKHLDYIHYNPVKHGHTQNVKDWAFSSFEKFVEQQNYDINWGSADDVKHIATMDYD